MGSNATYRFVTTQSDFKHLNNKLCTIIRPLTEKECDMADVGLMFKVKFYDNTVIDAFFDELWFVRP